MKLSRFSIRVLTALLTLSTMGWGPLAAAQNESPAMSSREFRASLTPNERKLPRDILAQQRLAEGKFVPASWEQAVQMRSQGRSAAGASEQVFRLDGESVEALESVLSQMGAETLGRSVSRGYVTASLSDDQVVSASTYAAVRRIRYVKGPTAQGVTEAWFAHRAAELSDANATISTKPAITGDKVVIGLISLPYDSDDLAVLDALTTRVIPTSENLFELTGATDPEGTADLLNMLQVIYDIAPGATVVLGSPGSDSTPAQMHTLIDQLVAGSGSVGSAGYVPPANIIVDDLDFLTQNPFEVGEISEAIVDARAAGVLYVTAAGDGGHYETSNSTSNVYVENFNSQTPTSNTGIYAEVFGNLHAFSANQFELTLSEPHLDICVYWNEDPGDPVESNDIIMLAFPGNDAAKLVELSNFGTQPGGCLSEQYSPVPDLPTGTKLLFEDNSEALQTDRFMVVGRRGIVYNGQSQTPSLDSLTGAFDLSTPGAIRGHAYHPDALTVGTTPYIKVGSDVKAFEGVSTELTVSDYSADGESISQQRFYWKNVGSGSPNWLPIASGAGAVAKPDMTAASSITVKDSNDTALVYKGTSASAAVTAGIAALYWEFRQWQLNDRKVEGGQVSSEDIRLIMRASVIDGGTAGWDRQFGQGVLDAPKALEIPLPTIATTLSVAPEDADSVSVSWIVDYLADNNAATSTLNCSQNGTSLVTNQTDAGSGSVIVNAGDTSPVECTLSTAFTAGGVSYSNSTTPLTGSATPEALNTGLPIWMLYIATQPE